MIAFFLFWGVAILNWKCSSPLSCDNCHTPVLFYSWMQWKLIRGEPNQYTIFQIKRFHLVPACVISVINRDDSSAEGLQYNRYKNNSLSPQRTEDCFQYKRYFNISDFILTEFYLQRIWETKVGDLLLFQYKRYFKLSDFIISGVSCTV